MQTVRGIVNLPLRVLKGSARRTLTRWRAGVVVRRTLAQLFQKTSHHANLRACLWVAC